MRCCASPLSNSPPVLTHPRATVSARRPSSCVTSTTSSAWPPSPPLARTSSPSRLRSTTRLSPYRCATLTRNPLPLTSATDALFFCRSGILLARSGARLPSLFHATSARPSSSCCCSFQGLGTTFYRGSDGAIFVFDVTRKATFDALLQWKKAFLIQVHLFCLY